jgi:hypothetical protein
VVGGEGVDCQSREKELHHSLTPYTPSLLSVFPSTRDRKARRSSLTALRGSGIIH